MLAVVSLRERHALGRHSTAEPQERILGASLWLGGSSCPCPFSRDALGTGPPVSEKRRLRTLRSGHKPTRPIGPHRDDGRGHVTGGAPWPPPEPHCQAAAPALSPSLCAQDACTACGAKGAGPSRQASPCRRGTSSDPQCTTARAQTPRSAGSKHGGCGAAVALGAAFQEDQPRPRAPTQL